MSNERGLTTPTGRPVTHVGAAFDPIEDEFRRAPQTLFWQARSDEPVSYGPTVQAYVPNRYSDINAALLDADTFSAAPAADFVSVPCLPAGQIRLLEGQNLEFIESLVCRGPTRLYAEWDPSQKPRAGGPSIIRASDLSRHATVVQVAGPRTGRGAYSRTGTGPPPVSEQRQLLGRT